MEKKELDLFLSVKNPYTEFISWGLRQEKLILKEVSPTEFQWHHILPRSARGTDHEFNLIKLSYANHIIAHQLLYQVYQREQDRLAVRFMTNDPSAHQYKIELAHRASKLNQTGFNSSANQSIQGKKGGATPSFKKELRFAEKQTPERSSTS